MNDRFNAVNDRFNAMNDRFKTTNGAIVYKKGMERNDRFNTTEWNRTIAFNTTERNGAEVKQAKNKWDLNGNGTATAVPLHGIQMGTFY